MRNYCFKRNADLEMKVEVARKRAEIVEAFLKRGKRVRSFWLKYERLNRRYWKKFASCYRLLPLPRVFQKKLVINGKDSWNEGPDSRAKRIDLSSSLSMSWGIGRPPIGP